MSRLTVKDFFSFWVHLHLKTRMEILIKSRNTLIIFDLESQ